MSENAGFYFIVGLTIFMLIIGVIALLKLIKEEVSKEIPAGERDNTPVSDGTLKGE
jgi:hypothetical protein